MTHPSQPLRDILDSGRAMQGWCAGRTFTQYEAGRQLRRSVEREFEIIGEALTRPARVSPESAARAEHLPKIVGCRNRIIHGYDAIGHATAWGVVAGYLPPRLAEVESLLKEMD
jgi:uncharacterized protein with HEPN domain